MMALSKCCGQRCKQSRTPCSKFCCKCIKHNLEMLFILLGVVAGITLGICLRLYVPAFQEPDLHPREVQYLYFPAEIFIRMMTFMSLPLLVSSLVSGIGSLDIKSSGRIGLYVFCYYIATTALAIVEGFIYVYIIKPGVNVQANSTSNITSQEISTVGDHRIESFLDMIRNMFPDNIITPTFQMHKTSITYENISLPGKNESIEVEHLQTEKVDAINILGITFVSIVFAIALSFTGEKGKPLFAIFEIMFETVMKIMNVLLWLYPVGIMFLLATTAVRLKDPIDVLQKVSMFIVTSLASFFTHEFFVLPLVYFVFVRKNPYRHLIGCLRALLTGFTTTSSAMALPVTMTCLKKLGCRDSIIRFMAPIGATINMDGTALYYAIAPVFMAMMYGRNPGPSQILILGATAVAVSIGTPTTGDNMVLYIIMFKSIGVPLKDIGLLMSYDWIMVRFRAVVNISGDCFGVGVVQKLSSSRSTDREATEEPEMDDVELSFLNKAAKENS